ncbi:hypothetical protein CapIbe_014685 [Capra ibex]
MTGLPSHTQRSGEKLSAYQSCSPSQALIQIQPCSSLQGAEGQVCSWCWEDGGCKLHKIKDFCLSYSVVLSSALGTVVGIQQSLTNSRMAEQVLFEKLVNAALLGIKRGPGKCSQRL